MDCAFTNHLVGVGKKGIAAQPGARAQHSRSLFSAARWRTRLAAVWSSDYDCDEYTVRAPPQNTRETLMPGEAEGYGKRESIVGPRRLPAVRSSHSES